MKKVIIWGTGKTAQKYLKDNYFNNCEIVAFISNDNSIPIVNELPVFKPDDIVNSGLKYDYIIVANTFSLEIKIQCEKLNLDFKKIIFPFNYIFKEERIVINEYQNDEDIIKVSEKLYDDISTLKFKEQAKYSIQACGLDRNDKKSCFINNEYYSSYYIDYVRYRNFELISNEIKSRNIQGDIAEVGVFRGDFAKLINETFENKKLYLFDTFESFDREEFDAEVKRGRCSEELYNTHLNTSCDIVMEKMKYPENCIIKKGLFPQTAVGLENLKFSFVSIDTDLENSIYESLKWFYPRLNEGGYIFLHDYNHYYLGGVKIAVSRFEREFGKMKIVPIADSGGTLIIVK